jgi:iron(III) transport system substrate-binding protein
MEVLVTYLPLSRGRRRVALLAGVAALSVALSACAAGSGDDDNGATGGSGAETVESKIGYVQADRAAHLLECAKTEGSVNYYSTSSAAPTLKEPFEAAHPGVTMNVTSSPQASQQLVQEENAGRHNFDVMDDAYGLLARDDKMFAKLPKEPYAGVRDQVKGDYYVGTSGYILSLGYNADVVGTGAPTSWQALVDPKWKGKMWISGGQTGEAVMALMEKEYGKEFAEQLAANVRLQSSMAPRALADALLAKQMDIALNVTSSYIKTDTLDKKNGFRFGIMDPMIGQFQVASVSKNAPHPCGAALLVDWLTNKDGGQAVFAKAGRASPLNDQPILPFEVPGSDPTTWKIVYNTEPAYIEGYDSTEEALSAWHERFRELFNT